MLKQKLLMYVASFKAAEMWMHAAHHLTKGPNFIATHELLYGRIYETLSDDFDKIVEKMVYQMNDEDFACPILISEITSQILKRYESPSGLDEKSIAMSAMILIVDHMKGIESLRTFLDNQNLLTLGIDDFLAAAQNQYESYAYMINQHIKI